MAGKNVITEILDNTNGNGSIVLATLNRPDALNALNDELMDELFSVLDDYEIDDDLRCLILTGSDKAFAAGADIKQMQPKSYMDVYKEDFISRNWENITKQK